MRGRNGEDPNIFAYPHVVGAPLLVSSFRDFNGHSWVRLEGIRFWAFGIFWYILHFPFDGDGSLEVALSEAFSVAFQYFLGFVAGYVFALRFSEEFNNVVRPFLPDISAGGNI